MEKKSTLIEPVKRRKVIAFILKGFAGLAVLNILPIRLTAGPVKKAENKKIKATEHPLAVKYGARKVNRDE